MTGHKPAMKLGLFCDLCLLCAILLHMFRIMTSISSKSEDKPEIVEHPEFLFGTGTQFKPPGVGFRKKNFEFLSSACCSLPLLETIDVHSTLLDCCTIQGRPLLLQPW